MKFLPVLFLAGFFAFNLQAADKPKAAKGKLTSIQGIAAAAEAKLEKAGVTSVDELLEQGATRKGREDLAAKSGVSAPQILKFVNYADLFRIKGIAGQLSCSKRRA